jgi:ribosomal protein L31E
VIFQVSFQVRVHLRDQKNPLPSPRPPSITRVLKENTKKKAEYEKEIHLRTQVNAQVSSHLRNHHLTVALRHLVVA